jgi:hypothetical protein
MAILSTPVEKAKRRLADIRAEIGSARSRLASGLDFEADFALREEIAVLERKEAAAAEALGTAKASEAKAAAEVEKAADLAEIAAYDREAKREMPGRFNRLQKHMEAAASELAEIHAHTERARHINELARKHGLPGVVDGEVLFRATPIQIIPAEYRTETVWRDGAGRAPAVFRRADDGELVPNEGGYMKTSERVEVNPERRVGGQLPGGRLAPAIRLVSLNGRQIWPAR